MLLFAFYSRKNAGVRLIKLLLFLSTGISTNAQCWHWVDAGGAFTMGQKSNKTILTWGANTDGQLGNGGSLNQPAPNLIINAANWKVFSAGNAYVLAIKNDGTLWAWGNNDYGQLGNGNNLPEVIPVQVGTDNNWETVAAGDHHSLALKNDGSLWGWGHNGNGEAGLGTLSGTNAPVLIDNSNNWKQIVCGWHHSLAIKSNGSLWAWGGNFVGQCGSGTSSTLNLTSPVNIASGGWLSVTAGAFHSAGIKNDSTVWCWGLNNTGQLGDGTKINKNVPVQAGNAGSWMEVAAGYGHTSAIKSDGTLWDWGGAVINFTNPVQVGTENNWRYVSAGNWHSVALKKNGQIFCWGNNSAGQVGDGTTFYQHDPTQVMSQTCFLGYKEQQMSQAAFAWPNPAFAKVFIEQEVAEQIVLAELLDINGRIIISLKDPGNEIDVSSLPASIYLLKVFIPGKGFLYQKLVKE